MRIIKTIVFIALVVVGIVLASVNMQLVEFRYVPNLSFVSTAVTERLVQIPLALLVLAGVLVGAVVAGLGTFIEHVRLRSGLRKQTKLADKARAEAQQLRGQLEQTERRAEEAETRQRESEAQAAESERRASEATSASEAAERRATEAEERAAQAEQKLVAQAGDPAEPAPQD